MYVVSLSSLAYLKQKILFKDTEKQTEKIRSQDISN